MKRIRTIRDQINDKFKSEFNDILDQVEKETSMVITNKGSLYSFRFLKRYSSKAAFPIIQKHIIDAISPFLGLYGYEVLVHQWDDLINGFVIHIYKI